MLYVHHTPHTRPGVTPFVYYIYARYVYLYMYLFLVVLLEERTQPVLLDVGLQLVREA